MQRLGFDACCLFQVDVITLHQRAERTLTHVFMMMAAHQVIQHAFTQGAFAVIHALEFEGVEDGFQNRQACGENGATVGLDAIEVDLFHVTHFEQLALEPGQPFGVDLACAVTIGLERQADSTNGT